LLDKDIVVIGNPRVYKALRNSLAEVLAELQKIGYFPNDDLLEIIKLIATTLNGMKGENL